MPLTLFGTRVAACIRERASSGAEASTSSHFLRNPGPPPVGRLPRSLPPAPECAASSSGGGPTAGPHGRVSLDAFLASGEPEGPQQLRDWEVYLADATPVLLGRITAVDQREFDTLLRVLEEGAAGQCCHLIPLVSSIIQQVIPASRRLLIAPPPGLLELGRRPAQLTALLEAIQTLDPDLIRPTNVTQLRGAQVMPSAAQLKRSGRPDLISTIRELGGFAVVAQELGLHHQRRPKGYWDSPHAIDEELAVFIADNWTQHDDPDGGEPYYYNQVTGRTSWTPPQQPQVEWLEATGECFLREPEDDRLMPSKRAVISASRFDLHHAIQYHGGYRAVGELLGRPPTWPRYCDFDDINLLAWELKSTISELQMEVRAPGAAPLGQLPRGARWLARTGGVARIPSASLLREIGREDLVYAIHKHGGFHRVAAAIGLSTGRRPRATWTDLDRLAAEVADFMAEHPTRCPPDKLPSQKLLVDLGRPDLRYGVKVHGSQAVGRRLGLKVDGRGAHRRSQ